MSADEPGRADVGAGVLEEQREDVRRLTRAACNRYIYWDPCLRELVEELVEEAVLKHYTPERGALSTFIYQVVATRGLQAQRHTFNGKRNDPKSTPVGLWDTKYEPSLGCDPHSERDFAQVEDREAILRAVDKLDPKWLPAVQAMVAHPDEPINAAARAMRCSTNTIRHQVVHPLRQYLGVSA